MQITDREITKQELQDIYDDFTKIEQQDGLASGEQVRYSYTAEENGMVVGFASGLTQYKWFILSDMWVHESYRRKGLGSQLLTMLEEKVKSIDIEHIYLWTSGYINPIFYEKLGYKKFTVFENYYDEPGYNKIGYRKDFVQCCPVHHDGYEMQPHVQAFINKHNLQTTPQARYIDLVSEVGELGKEILSSTDYGKQPFAQTSKHADEIGDCLFSLLALCSTMGINAKDALHGALAKYAKRFQQKGSIGSND